MNQDIILENAFWKQLLSLYDDWRDCEMVGTLSWKAYQKIDLKTVDAIIKSRDLWSSGYYHFYVTDTNIHEDTSHPYLQTILRDTNIILNLDITGKSCYCNYWMCTPNAMLDFIPWVNNKLIPTVKSHYLSMTDAQYYIGLNEDECLKMWGLPYYPHLCFVIERLIPCYFETNLKSTLPASTEV